MSITLRSSRGTAAAIVALVAVLGVPGAGSAQGFDVQQFNPAPSQSSGYFGMLGARVLGHGVWEVGVLINHADDPLVLYDASGERAQSIVSRQVTANVLGAVGIADRLQLGFDVPVVISQDGDDIAVIPPGAASSAGGGLGDIRFVPTVLLFDSADRASSGVSMTLSVDLFLPTGDEDHFQGEGVRVAPRIAVDYGIADEARVGVELGYTVRPETSLANLEVNDTLTWGVAGELPVVSGGSVRLLAELIGELALLGDAGVQSEEAPIEGLLGAKWRHESGFGLEAAFGAGLAAGFGTPDWRGLFGLSLAPPSDKDRDDDGILNELDACPDEPEDLDGFEDADGCPDPDNDGDGFEDVVDECPDAPEDFDQFEDDDGCSEPDNDYDTIRDTEDRCPLEPEDFDGFEDADGCPDPDNDGDHILDVDDGCPNEMEDIDGFDDFDGCPEPDNDHDGFSDLDDRCPTEPEDFDGFEDDDGCPEEGEGLVELTCTGIEIRESVYFRSDSDQIRARSHELLDQVGSVLENAPAVTRIRVEGHTDSRGSDEHNMELSERRAAAVSEYLIERVGIAPERLESRGFGETMPIADNDHSDGRAQNRRVEFVIVEQDRCRE